MAIRFRKSLKLAPGIRMNLSGGGLSWTLGPRGASIGIGKRGTYLNTGLPGTGLYSRQRLSSGPAASGSRVPTAASGTTNITLTVSVADDGAVTFRDEGGNLVSDALIMAAKKQKGDTIMGLIHGKCAEINSQVSALGEIHLDTPSPSSPPVYRVAPFETAPPRPTVPRVPGFIEGLFKSKRQRIEEENSRAEARFQEERSRWQQEKEGFEVAQLMKQSLVARAVSGQPEAMEEFFGEVLMDIVWPRETAVSFEVRADGTQLWFDVDLPEVEDMPSKTASVPQRGYKLSVKQMSPTAVQKLYAQHVHSIAFRLVGEAFAMLPTVQEVTLSGYSQRKDKATGREADEYLLSVVVPRAAWAQADFNSLKAVDVMEALPRFQLRRDMTKTGIFKPVQPFGQQGES